MKNGIVAEIADAPFRIAHALAVPGGKVPLPLQAERRVQIVGVPALLRGAVMFEIVDIETDVIDDIVARVGQIRRRNPAVPIPDTSRT